MKRVGSLGHICRIMWVVSIWYMEAFIGDTTDSEIIYPVR